MEKKITLSIRLSENEAKMLNLCINARIDEINQDITASDLIRYLIRKQFKEYGYTKIGLE